VDLSAHLEGGGRVVQIEHDRDARDLADVGTDVLTRVTVAPRDRADEDPLLVAHADRHAVDLQLTRPPRCGALQVALDALGPLPQAVGVEHVVQ
jgi:hypothetical protein